MKHAINRFACVCLVLLVALNIHASHAAPQVVKPEPDKTVIYKSTTQGNLNLHLFNPKGHKENEQRPAIVFFFGGGWTGGKVSQFYPQSQYLAARGMVAICAEYRVSSRHDTTPKECVQDGKSAIRWVRAHAKELGIDPKKIAAGGGSAGGHVAAATATVEGFDEPGEDTTVSCQPNALVLFNPVIDNGPSGYGYQRVEDYWLDFSPLHNLDEQTPPTIFLLGTRDKLIPVATAKQYQDKMKSNGTRCELVLYEGQEHAFFNEPKKHYADTLAEMDKFLVSLDYLEGEQSGSNYVDDRATRMQWWREAKFGMFVHWGIYSVVGGEYKGQKLPNSAEWMMNRGKIPIAEYRKYAEQFNPTSFNADDFVRLAKKAGMKYLVITAKHHDGFSMFGSKCSSYNVVDATPFKRDIMKELAVACHKQGIRFGFYYSQAQDWHHPGGVGNGWDKTIKRVSTDEYVRDKAAPEVKQLMTEYGPIAIFWWDTPRKMSKESYDSLHSLTALQPGVITNDRLGKDYPGDHATFERHIPKQAPANEHWEVCMPISGSWGYKKSDTDFKSTENLIRNLVDIASKGGNYLLNVSPTGEGALLPQATERLKAIGKWMEVNSESIYGTTASPFGKLEWGRCTKKGYAKGTTLYLHVFDWPEDGKLVVAGLKNEVNHAYLMDGWQPLEISRDESGVIVSLPAEAPDEFVSVIVMHVSGPVDVEIQPATPVGEEEGTLHLLAEAAYIHNNEAGNQAKVQEKKIPNIGYWTDPQAWIEWSVKFDQLGTYEVSAELAIKEKKSKFGVGLPKQHATVEVEPTGDYGTYKQMALGTLEIKEPGTHPIQIVPQADSWQPINLRKVILKRKE